MYGVVLSQFSMKDSSFSMHSRMWEPEGRSVQSLEAAVELIAFASGEGSALSG